MISGKVTTKPDNTRIPNAHQVAAVMLVADATVSPPTTPLPKLRAQSGSTKKFCPVMVIAVAALVGLSWASLCSALASADTVTDNKRGTTVAIEQTRFPIYARQTVGSTAVQIRFVLVDVSVDDNREKCTVSAYRLLTQSDPMLQPCWFAQLVGQEPPQSMSVSVPLRMLSVQLGTEQLPALHFPL